MTSTVQVSVFAGARTAVPVDTAALSWTEFAEQIASLCRSDASAALEKINLVAVAPWVLKPGTTRAAANISHMGEVIALDLDGSDANPVNYEALVARLDALGADAIVHGSPSDSPATRKLRVYVRVDRTHSPSEAGAYRLGLESVLGVHCDRASLDAARLFFAGRLVGTPPRHFRMWDTGRALALDSVPKGDVRAALPQRDAPAACPVRVKTRAAIGAILGALGGCHDWDGSKHAICGALGGALRKAGWAESECAELIREWLGTGGADVDVEKGVKWACGAWGKLESDVSGRAALASVTGEDVASVIEMAALLPWRVATHPVGTDTDACVAVEADYPLLPRVDLTRPPAPLDYLVESLELAPGKVSALQGYANAGKTPFALLLGVCVAAGLPLLGRAVRQAPCLYLDFESSPLTHERYARICAGLKLDPGALPFELRTPSPLNDAVFENVERYMRTRSPGLVVVDTYSSALADSEVNFNDSAFRNWAVRLGGVSSSTGATVIVLLHDNKGGGADGLRRIGGHSALAGALQASVALVRSDEDRSTVHVSCSRAVRHGFPEWALHWTDPEDPSAPTGQALLAEAVAIDDVAAQATKALPSPSGERDKAVREAGTRLMAHVPPGQWATRNELLPVAGGNRRAALEALARLVDGGLLTYHAGAYALTDTGASSDPLAIARALGKVGQI